MVLTKGLFCSILLKVSIWTTRSLAKFRDSYCLLTFNGTNGYHKHIPFSYSNKSRIESSQVKARNTDIFTPIC